MNRPQQGIGLMIGDAAAVAAGLAPDGTEWSVAQQAAVCPPSAAATVDLLLAGDEARAAGEPSLLAPPRQWGYVTGDAGVARDLLAALLATVRQQVPPAYLEQLSYPPVLVLSHRVTAAAAQVVAEAALDAGWGKVRIVSELSALAAMKASFTEAESLTVACVDGAWLHQAAYQGTPAAGGYVLELTSLTTQRRQEGDAQSDGMPSEAHLARGGARLAARQEQVRLTMAPALPVAIGVAVDDGAVLPLGTAGEPVRLLRALHPPHSDGSLVRLMADCQVLLEEVVEPVPGDDGPWLMQVDLAEEGRGELRLSTPAGITILNRPFQVRLP